MPGAQQPPCPPHAHLGARCARCATPAAAGRPAAAASRSCLPAQYSAQSPSGSKSSTASWICRRGRDTAQARRGHGKASGNDGPAKVNKGPPGEGAHTGGGGCRRTACLHTPCPLASPVTPYTYTSHVGLVQPKVFRAGDGSLGRRRQVLARPPPRLDLCIDALQNLQRTGFVGVGEAGGRFRQQSRRTEKQRAAGSKPHAFQGNHGSRVAAQRSSPRSSSRCSSWQ